MKASDIVNPAVLEMPFAVNGDKNNIPATNSPSSGDASQSLGFPPVTQISVDAGGIPPARQDFNGLGYLSTSHSFYAQNGNFYTFDNNVSAAIGGYPKGAKLWYTDSDNNVRLLLSTKDDNTDNFISNPEVIGASWVDCVPTLGEVKESTLQYNRVSNCILSYPQKINYELAADGTLTIKAGTTVYVPNGPGVYTPVTLQSDVVRSNPLSTVTGTAFIGLYNALNAPAISFSVFSNMDSGNSSTPGNNILYYNEDLNTIKYYNPSGNLESEDWSFFLLQVTVDNGVIKSVDQVLDYQSFIGHWQFVFPGLTGLIPNGLNSDGTLNNIQATTTNVARRKYTWSTTKGQRVVVYPQSNTLGSSGIITRYYEQDTVPPNIKNTYWLNTSNNIMYYNGDDATSWEKDNCFYIGDIWGDNTGKITSLAPRSALRVLDTSTFEKVYLPQIKKSTTINYEAAIAKSHSTQYTSTGGAIYGEFQIDYNGSTLSKLYINGELVADGKCSAILNAGAPFFFLVPNGVTYKLDQAGTLFFAPYK